RIIHVIVMPRIRVLAPNPMQVRSGAFGPPKERMIIDEFACLRVFAITLRLAAKGPHHLRMATDATFADVKIPSEHFERRVRLHAGDGRDVVFDEIHGDNLNQPADEDGHKGQGREQNGLGFKPTVAQPRSAGTSWSRDVSNPWSRLH